MAELRLNPSETVRFVLLEKQRALGLSEKTHVDGTANGSPSAGPR
jgi:hypothetical protein